MASTTAREPTSVGAWSRTARPVLVVVLWLGLWQLATVLLDQAILLVGPGEVVVRLAELATTTDFWATVGRSFGRIVAGFAAAAVVGVLGAALAARSRTVESLAAPLVTAVRSTPVVSVILLVLIVASSAQLATTISFLMVGPIVYTTVLQGIRHRDSGLLEMAAVFRVPALRRVVAVDVPAVLPYFVAACQVGIGLAWKSGIAAEVIGLPQGSIGEQLYQAKVFLTTADLFAWTVVVVTISYGVERVVLALLDRGQRRLTREPRRAPAGEGA